MNGTIEKIKGFRSFLLKEIEGLTTKQLNEIPAGFDNNIAWNLGHLISVQQNMCYVKAGLPTVVEEHLLSGFLPGTKPAEFIGEEQLLKIKEALIGSMDQSESDYAKGLFENYTPVAIIAKIYGFDVDSIDDALEYVLHHDGQHAGYILALKKLV